MDIKLATGGKTKQKYNKFVILGVYNAMHNNRLKPVRIPLSESAKNNAVLLFCFLPVAILISNRFQCVISQIKENKISDQIHNSFFFSRG